MYDFKSLWTVACLLSSLLANGQAYTVHVIDSLTREPLVYATVSATDYGCGAESTDMSGRATITCGEPGATIVVSYIGYQSRTIALGRRNAITVDLQTVPYDLGSVLVTSEKVSIDPAALVKRAISNIRANYSQQPEQFPATYTESFRVNDSLYMETTAQTRISYSAYPAKNYVAPGFKKYYGNNYRRPYPVLDTTGKHVRLGNPFFFKYYADKEDTVLVESIKTTEYGAEERYRLTTEGGPLGLLALDKVKFQSDCLDKKLVNAYRFELTSVLESGDDLVYVVAFRPKAAFQVKRIKWNEKVKYPILSGRIFIRKGTAAIDRIECQFAANGKLYSYQLHEGWQVFPSSTTLEITYGRKSDEYLIDTIRVKQICLANRSRKYRDDIEVIRELIRLPGGSNPNGPAGKTFNYEDVMLANFRDVAQFLD